MSRRFVHITPRLAAAADMLKGYETVADVGCDHGRLTAALLQQNGCRKVIASDISDSSLEKARRLIAHIGLADRVSFCVGDGCSVLEPGECDAIAMLGMGGTLMCRILEACSVPLAGAKALVLQPMRAQDEIREYLYRKGYRTTDASIRYSKRKRAACLTHFRTDFRRTFSTSDTVRSKPMIRCCPHCAGNSSRVTKRC